MKTCSICGEELSFELFYRKRDSKDGLTHGCKTCMKLKSTSWYKDNKEKALETRRAYNKKWRAENKDKHSAQQANRRASKIKATPPWLSAYDIEMIGWTYEACKIAERKYGLPYHVDHIVPLKGENVCGLHVPWNLQVIPAKDNLKKGNTHKG